MVINKREGFLGILCRRLRITSGRLSGSYEAVLQ